LGYVVGVEDWIAACEQSIEHLTERIERQQNVVDRHRAAGHMALAATAEELLSLMDDTLDAPHMARLTIHRSRRPARRQD
jgi:hypothetical protein